MSPLLFIPLGILIGTQAALLSDFGASNTIENIKANPDIFAAQYASSIVISGWITIAILALCILIVMVEKFRKGDKKEKS
jgi:hypothetical protein